MNRIMTEDIDRILAENLSWEKFKGTRTLITGASGMLGGYMLNVLISLREKHGFDMELYGLVRNPDKLPGEVRDKIHVIRQSVVDPIPDDLEPDHVIHTASPASPLIMREDPVGTIAANTIGTYNTLEAARKGSRKGYLFISSREIYGQPYDDQRVFTEDTYGFVDPLDPRSCYPEGKKAAETMCASYRAEYGLDAKAARLAFEFTQVLDYEIIQVIRNNEDITNNFMVNGSISSLFISSQDSRSGNGYYTVTLKYGDRDDEILQFSFFINDYEPTLSSNVAYGETTTSEIIISYNPSYIYSQLGVCYINVLIYNEDSETFYQYGRFRIDETTTETLSSFNLTQSNSYFIQVETESGNIVSSFRVNKTDPLNTFAIIIIVIAVVATIVLIIVVIKLRTRMRVR